METSNNRNFSHGYYYYYHYFYFCRPYCYNIYNYNYGNTSHVLQLIDRLIELELHQSSLNSSYIDKECDDSLYIPLLIDLYFIYKNRHLLNNVTTNERIRY